MKDKQQEIQSMMDLVAVYTLTNIFLHQQQQQEQQEPHHQSDSALNNNVEIQGEQQTDEPITIFNKKLSPASSWRLVQLIRHFFSTKN